MLSSLAKWNLLTLVAGSMAGLLLGGTWAALPVSHGRVGRWAQDPEMEGKYLRVILLSDGEAVHNAFFDRSFKR